MKCECKGNGAATEVLRLIFAAFIPLRNIPRSREAWVVVARIQNGAKDKKISRDGTVSTK